MSRLSPLKHTFTPFHLYTFTLFHQFYPLCAFNALPLPFTGCIVSGDLGQCFTVFSFFTGAAALYVDIPSRKRRLRIGASERGYRKCLKASAECSKQWCLERQAVWPYGCSALACGLLTVACVSPLTVALWHCHKMELVSPLLATPAEQE